jgi:hypothetical protein
MISSDHSFVLGHSKDERRFFSRIDVRDRREIVAMNK